ncbi:MAG: T9SS type B sorting domain-containing protein [Bacteroidetes bacterium]|nr:MAG: T9SS type B sorting domain-containing protein [Bacteroidota bacterium]
MINLAKRRIHISLFNAILFLGIFFSFIPSLKASHLMGSDITYQCLGNNRYKITLTVYRDCGGTTLGVTFNLPVKCKNSTWTTTVMVRKESVTDITGIGRNCPSSFSSKCKGGNYPYGIEQHIYTGIVDVSSSKSVCNELIVSWTQNARNKSITTGAADETFYTEASIFTDISCNSSPIFTTPAAALVCVNTDFVFNNGALDTVDNDILTYSLVSPLQAAGSPLGYISPYSAQKPLRFLGFPDATLPSPSGFHLDSSTGNLNFRPTLLNQVTVLVLQVTEWRKVNGVLRVVGITRRDMQMSIINCNNNTPPKITATQDTTCPGQQVCINITTFDSTATDSVFLDWNSGIPNAIFTKFPGSNPKQQAGQLCWTPKSADGRVDPHYFTVTANDNSCPMPGQAVKALSIYVVPTAPIIVVNDTNQCAKGHIYNFTNNTPNRNNFIPNWQISDATSYSSMDIVGKKFNDTGNYVVKLMLHDTVMGCKDTGQMTVRVKPEPDLGVSLVNFSSTFCVGATPTPYTLVPGPQGGMFFGKNVSGNIYTPKILGPDTIMYYVSVEGCEDDTLIYTTVAQRPKAVLKINTAVQCFKAQQYDFTNQTTNPNKHNTYWLLSDSTTYTSVDLSGKKFADTGLFTVKLVVQDTASGCTDTTQGTVRVKPQPDLSLPTVGLKSQYCVTSTPPPHTLVAGPQGGVFSGKNVSGNIYTPKILGLDTVKYAASLNGCDDDTLLFVTVSPKPQASFTINKKEQCFSVQQFDFTNTSSIVAGTYTNRWQFTGGWQANTVDAKQVKFLVSGKSAATLIITSQEGCVDSTSDSVTVYADPIADFTAMNSFYCVKAGDVVLIPTVPGGVFSGTNVKGNVLVPTKAGNDSVRYTVTVNGCTSHSVQYFKVYPQPSFPATVSDVSCFKEPITLNVAIPDASYLWHDGSTSPTYMVTDTGKYHVMIYHICDTIEKTILAKDCYYGVTPTAFTPNGDGVNDFFMPYLHNAVGMDLKIYSRWGELVFETTDLSKGWDGSFKGAPLPDGVYTWLLLVDYIGERQAPRRSIENGTITLLR